MEKQETFSANELGIASLSVVLLVLLAVDTMVALPAEIHAVIQKADTIACLVFFCDFCARLLRAESKLAFMKWGWIDLLASIPNVDVLRWGRLVRVLRVLRLLRAIRSVHRVLDLTLKNKVQAGAVTLAGAAFLLILFSSVSILIFEVGTDANIKTGEDAIWWSVTTMTTVGYGDRFPTSTEGRIVGMILMIAGIGVFGALSGIVASMFLRGRQGERSRTDEILERLKSLEQRIGAVQQSVENKDAARDEEHDNAS